MSRAEILKAALELPETDRMLLAQELMDTIPEESALWSIEDRELLDELDRRLNDGTPGIPWEVVREELRRPRAE